MLDSINEILRNPFVFRVVHQQVSVVEVSAVEGWDEKEWQESIRRASVQPYAPAQKLYKGKLSITSQRIHTKLHRLLYGKRPHFIKYAYGRARKD